MIGWLDLRPQAWPGWMAQRAEWTDGWTDGRMDGRMDGRTDRWTDGRMDGWMDGRMDGRMHGRTDRQTDGQTDAQTDGWIDRQMDGRTDRWTDGLTDKRKENLRCPKKEYIMSNDLRHVWPLSRFESYMLTGLSKLLEEVSNMNLSRSTRANVGGWLDDAVGTFIG